MAQRSRTSGLIRVATAALAAVCIGAAGAEAGGLPCGGYDVQVIQHPCPFPFWPSVTTVTGLNNRGQVCGYYGDCNQPTITRPFIWTPETGLVTIPTPPGASSVWPADINDHGVIVGTMSLAGVGFRGFVYEDGEWTTLEPPFPEGDSEGFTINNAGTVCGKRSLIPAQTPSNAFKWTARDGFTDMPDVGQSTQARGINEGGVIVGFAGGIALPGQRGFLWIDDTVTFLTQPEESLWYSAVSINAAGAILGGATYQQPKSTATFGRPVVWEGDAMTILPLLDGFASCGGSDIDDNGVVVGRCQNPGMSNQARGVIWFDNSPLLLGTLIDSEPAVVIQLGRRINDNGQILASGKDKDGFTVGLLLTPEFGQLGDLNCDGVVNGLDLGILLANWSIPPSALGCRGLPSSLCAADLNGDGLVNGLDLGILLASWTFE